MAAAAAAANDVVAGHRMEAKARTKLIRAFLGFGWTLKLLVGGGNTARSLARSLIPADTHA